MRDCLIVHYHNALAGDDTIPSVTVAVPGDSLTILNTLDSPVRMTAVNGGELLDPAIPAAGVVLAPGKPNRTFQAGAATGSVKLHFAVVHEGGRTEPGARAGTLVGDPEIIISGGQPETK